MGADTKPLPTVARLKDRIGSMVADIACAADADSHAVRAADVSRLAAAAAGEFALRADELRPLLSGFAGVPPEGAWGAMRDLLERWIPALRAGYAYSSAMKGGIDRIPHTVVVGEPEFDCAETRWRTRLSFVDGPLRGTESRLLLAHNIACLLVVRAFGVRRAYSLGSPRPYDAHGARVLVLPTLVRGSVGIGRLPSSAAMVRANQKLRGRFDTCGRDYSCVCFDCGLGEGQCPLARHAKQQVRGICCMCGHARVTTGTGVCLVCLDRLTKDGVPSRPRCRA